MLGKIYHVMEKRLNRVWLRERVFETSHSPAARELFEDAIDKFGCPQNSRDNVRLVKCEVLDTSNQLRMELTADDVSPFAKRKGEPMHRQEGN